MHQWVAWLLRKILKHTHTHTHWQAASRASCTFIKQHPESLVSFCSSLSFLFTLYLLESTLKPCCHSFLCHSSFDTTHSLGKNGIKEYEMKIMLLFALWLFLLWLELVWFFMFLKYISSAYEDCIYLIKNTVKKQQYCETLLQFKITGFYYNIFSNIVYFCDAKQNFQHHYSCLQCHMILQKSF